MIEQEEWRAIPGWEGLYEVSSLGRARSLDRITRGRWGCAALKRGKLLSPSVWDGYPFLKLRDGTKQKRIPLHSAVALAFIGPRPLGTEVCHADGNRLNAMPANLRYASRKENHADMVEHGTRRVGEKHHATPLTSRDVSHIRTSGLRPKDLAERYGISSTAICNIIHRKTWRHV